jgi:putative ABC transport system substrate-binding protein
MKSIIRYLFSVALLMALLPISSVEAKTQHRITALMFSDEPRYLEALKGVTDTLAKAGYKEPGTVIKVLSGHGNKIKTIELVKEIAADKPDLIVTLGTYAASAVSNTIKDVPIVFSIVYDPVVAGIAKNWQSSGNNTAGSSTKISLTRIMESLGHFSSVKTLAVLYTPAEKNSVEVLKDLQIVEAGYKIRILPVRLSTVEEIHQLLPEVLRSAGALYITGSNLIGGQIVQIMDMATKAKLPTITHLEDMVEKGVLMGVCADSYAMGQEDGAKAVKILAGAKPSSIPINKAKKSDVLLNMKTAQKGQFQIPASFMKTVTRKIE